MTNVSESFNDVVTRARSVVAELGSRGLTLATAESLTAGLVSARIADVAGASAVLRGGAATYATECKAAVLGVDAELLSRCGAVDSEVARQMALAAARLFGADVGVSTTGVAGPAEQDGKSVGTCFVAVHVAGESDDEASRCTVNEYHFDGDREAVRMAVVAAALAMVLDAVAPDAQPVVSA